MQSKYRTLAMPLETSISNDVNKTIHMQVKGNILLSFCDYLHDHNYSNKQDTYLQFDNCNTLIIVLTLESDSPE